ncbi:molybdenum cofactor guanylyltransferase [Sphingomonas sp. 2R-10]|uniref:molybdenum cofactor guanylyltransferase n=1 Tax=Sphingomonas sp. 2R-10 TaxID=3045148 RepID=UPI000F7B048D|nr:molybdenum cofactor guanylyltransferase [Sphingomonas sp. 2R-10]MDJ0277745.1 molybdenum cofactor guanylyltransferase [Sphingomonas sp. 2R-10]
MTRVLGAILGGGRSSRFGSDKALATLGGQALIDRVAAALAPQVDAMIVVGRDHPGLTAVADRPAPDLGPLGGIAGALHHAVTHGFDRILTVPCDAPFLPDDLRERLSAAGPAVFLHDLPVIGGWPTDTSPALDRLLAEGGSRSVRAFADRIGAVGIAGGGIANINTPDDLARIAAQRD